MAAHRRTGVCPVCDGTYYLTGNGAIRDHQRTVRIVGRIGALRRITEPCPGSGRRPRSTR